MHGRPVKGHLPHRIARQPLVLCIFSAFAPHSLICVNPRRAPAAEVMRDNRGSLLAWSNEQQTTAGISVAGILFSIGNSVIPLAAGGRFPL
jgi:hypothetical protein